MEERECRICFSEDNSENMISPCYCRGTSKWVHHECLNKWRNSRNTNANKKCTECNFKYHYNEEILYKNKKCDKFFDFILKTDYLLLFSKFITFGISVFFDNKKYNFFSFKNTIINNYLFCQFIFYIFAITFILLSLLFIKNKSLYYKNNKYNIKQILILSLFSFLSFKIFGILFILLFGLLFRNILVSHLKTIYVIKKLSCNNVKSFTDQEINDLKKIMR